MRETLNRIHIVLVEPKNPGNIGATVRAMKTMGFRHLRLVNPAPYRDQDEQRKMGYRSQEIIRSASDHPTLAAALADMTWIFAATTRQGKWKKDFLTASQAAQKIGEQGAREKIALVFGREDKGLTIDECQLANYFIKIPAAVSYPSLNLSQAVQVVAYEIYQKLADTGHGFQLPRLAEKQSLERLVDNIWDLMKAMEVREPDKGLFHRSLKRAINRTRWTNSDVAVFDRFCKQVRWFIQNRCQAGSKE